MTASNEEGDDTSAITTKSTGEGDDVPVVDERESTYSSRSYTDNAPSNIQQRAEPRPSMIRQRHAADLIAHVVEHTVSSNIDDPDTLAELEAEFLRKVELFAAGHISYDGEGFEELGNQILERRAARAQRPL